eukprot:7023588-Pyramimonas_sp.AAC.1
MSPASHGLLRAGWSSHGYPYIGSPITCGWSMNWSSSSGAGITASESAGAPAISRSESAGTWKSSTNSMRAGCPAIGAPNQSARLMSSWPR